MKKGRNVRKRKNIKLYLLLPVLIFSISIYGCPANSNSYDKFYLAGNISVQLQSNVSVYIAFYSNDCKVTYDQQGKITAIENFSIIGEPSKYDIVKSSDFLVVFPEPYNLIGGVLAWIDEDKNGSLDLFQEEAVLLMHSIEGKISVITGIVYDSTGNNFLVSYENERGTGQNYLTVIGNTDYSINF